MIDDDLVIDHRARALTPEKPVVRIPRSRHIRTVLAGSTGQAEELAALILFIRYILPKFPALCNKKSID